MENKKPEVPKGETSGFLPLDAGSTGTTMQGHAAFGIHFTLAIKAEGFLWLAGQCSALLLIFIKGQTTTTQRFQGQLFGFFGGVRAHFWRWMGRTSGKDSTDNQ